MSKDQYDEQAERLLPPIIDLGNGWADGFATYLRVYRPAVAAELSKRDQRIERLEAALGAIRSRAPIMGSGGDYRAGQVDALNACREIARAALED